MSVSKESTLNAFRTFKELQDTANTKKFVAKEQGKMLTSNDFTDALKSKLEMLSNYTLPTASSSVKGGVKIGDGLAMDGETLKVTLDNGEKYSEFTGATTTTDGTSGLVVKPNAGDDDKFLRGDGTWAVANTTVINMGGSATIIDTKVPAIQGALWQDVIDGTPCLKLRYDDYEYNFYYDTINLVGNVTPSLDSSAGMVYTLGTTPSTLDGGLWYELESSAPVLKLHDGNYNYGWRHDSVTYKGGTADLICYLPLDSPTPNDAITGTDFAVSGSPVVVDDTPLLGRAITAAEGSTWQFTSTAYPDTYKQSDMWFYLKPSIRSAGKDVQLADGLTLLTSGALQLKYTRRDGNYATNYTKTISFALPVDEPIHYSVQHNGYSNSGGYKYHKYRFYVNGQPAWSVTDVDNATSFIKMLPSGTAWSEHVAYNKLRLFSSVIWSEDFTPPVASDYL